MSARGESGFTLIEGLVTLTVLSVAVAILGSMLVQAGRINRQQRTQAELQESARTALSITVQALRTAGWNPRQVPGVSPVVASPSGTTTDDLTINADTNGDGTISGTDEIVEIRHVDDRIEWKRGTATGTAFETLAADITNDANGDGTAEPMFTLSSASAPKTVTVKITAQSKFRDLQSGRYQRYTVSSDVMLRSAQ